MSSPIQSLGLLALLVILIQPSQCQELFEKQLNYELQLSVSDLIATNDGYIVPCWASPSFPDSSISILLKTDEELNPIWAMRHKVNIRDFFTDIIELSDGNYLLSTAHRADFSLLVGGGLTKIDGDGNVLWSKVYTEDNDYMFMEVFEQSDGGFMAFIREGANNQPTRILELNSTGDILSERAYWNENFGVFADAVAQSGDAFYLNGFWLETQEWFYYSFLAAVDDSQLLWYKQLEYPRSTTTYSIVTASNGDLIVLGNILHATVTNAQNPYVTRFDQSGNVIWSREFLREEAAYTWNSTIAAVDDGFLISGQVNTLEGNDMYLYKIDGDGNVLWAKDYDQMEFETGIFSVENDDGSIILVGSSYPSPLLFKIDAMGNRACSSVDVNLSPAQLTVQVSELSPTLGQEEIEVNVVDPQLTPITIESTLLCDTILNVIDNRPRAAILYPNPSSDQLFVDFGVSSGNALITLTNSTGQPIMQEQVTFESRLEMDTSGLPSGFYVLNYVYGTESKSIPFMVVH